MGHEQAGIRTRLEQEAAAGNHVMFREGLKPATPWLGLFDAQLQRWVLVSPKTGSIALTVDQLLAFGFSDFLLVRLDGLERAG